MSFELETQPPAAQMAPSPRQVPGPTFGPRAKTAPVSLQQQRFWLLDQINPGNCACNISVRWKIAGLLDARLLKRAVAEIVRRHETLRTGVASVGGEPTQFIEPAVEFDIPVVDLRRLEKSLRDQEVQRLSEIEARRSFDLRHPPLFRLTILTLAEDEHRLLFSVHHIVADGWSLGVFVDEMAALYAALAKAEPSPLAELTYQYADYALRQRSTIQANVSNPQLLFWLRKLKDLPRPEVASDEPRPPVQTANGEIVSILLPADLTEKLKDISRANGATLFMTCLSALSVLLSRYMQSDTVVIGTPVAGRNWVEVEQLIGLFINLIVLRCDTSGDPSFQELLSRVRRTVVDGLTHQDMPFEQLVEVLKPRRDLSRTPLYQVNFIFQDAFVKAQKFASLELTNLPSVSSGALYDLNFFMVSRPEGWRASCEFNTDLYNVTTAQRMLSEFQILLQTIAEQPTRRLSSLLAQEEQAPAGPADPPRGLSEGKSAREAAAEESDVIPRYEEPEPDELENGLIRIWQDVLGVGGIRANDDFFELGGNSIRAAQLAQAINDVFGSDVPLPVLFESTTPRKLAATVRQRRGMNKNPRLIALQPEGDLPPFFMVNTFTRFVEVARKMAPRQPIYSLIGDDDKALSGNYDLFAEAAMHAETIMAVYPKGPYLLGGYSASGIIAFEVAQRLLEKGRHVALLVLFDAANPFFMREYSKVEDFRVWLRQSLAYHRSNLTGLGVCEIAKYLSKKVKGVLAGRVQWSKRLWRNLLGGRVREPEVAHDAFSIRIAASHHYRPKPYPGRVLLIKRDRGFSGRYLDPAFGWGGIARGGFEICLVPTAEHLDIFNLANGELIAAKLRARLAEAVADGEGSRATPSTAAHERSAAEVIG